MKVLLADDHEIVRTGLKHLLESHKAVKKVYEASNGKLALEILQEDEAIDLVVLDISMPELSGLDVLKKASSNGTDAKFLILSMYPEKEYALRALRAGASGYISKDSAAEELHNAIDSVLSGKKYVSKELHDILIEYNSSKTELTPHQTLSDREFKVFLMLAKGKRNQEIADKLFISSKTVSTYKSRIFEKMNVNSVQDLTKYAVNHKLIE